MDSYKKAMDRIKTDDAYKENFINLLQKTNTAKKKTVHFMSAFSYAASAAALVLVVYATTLFFMKQPENAIIETPPEIGTEITQYKESDEKTVIGVVYFTFDGFENYDIDTQSRAVLLKNFDRDYTMANLLSDYYPMLMDESSDVVINDGMIDSFSDIKADKSKEINVYINDREVLNLDEELVYDCIKLENNDVNFKVSVVEFEK